jgi:hypothetical protein
MVNENVEAAIGEISNLFSDEISGNKPQVESQEIDEQVPDDIEVDVDDIEEDDDIEDSEPVEDDVKPKESRAQKRIRELVSEKKELEAKLQETQQPQTAQELAELKALVGQLMQNKKETVEQVQETMPEFDTQQEFAEYIKNQTLSEVSKVLKEQLQPLQEETANTKYLSTINKWFQNNPEANNYKEAMDKLSETFSADEKAFYQKQIIQGKTNVLDSLFAQAAVKNKGLMKEAVAQDKKKAVMPKSRVSTTSAGKNELSDAEFIKKAYKKKDFLSVAESILPDYMR